MLLRAICVVLIAFGLVTHAVPISKTTSLHSAYPTIQTPAGDIQGAILTSRLGKNIYSFRGIRYAKAPIEELRFQPPVAPEKWEGVYNATQDGPACPQADYEPSSEDCLLLNVYTTKLPKGIDNPKRAVIVYFHDGDFTKGTGRSRELGPHYLLDQDVVLVTANYRIGVLGFLNTGDKEATGNFGLLDQIEVLKWVKSNIVAFGGNAESVTIAGTGSGAFSVSLHLVSSSSKGLFHRAIISSGSAFGNIPILNNQMGLAKRLAKQLNCPDDATSSGVVKCLRGRPFKDLVDNQCALKSFGRDPLYTWLPTMEQDFGQTRFLTAHPIELTSHDQLNKVPIMLGLSNDEFGCRAFDVIGNETLLEQMDKEFDKVAPIVFQYERDTENSKTISKDLRTFYFADGKIDNTSLPKLAEIYTDALVGFATHRTAEILAEKSNEPLYHYRFNYKGKLSNFYMPESNNATPYGVVHGDELLYLFNSNKFDDFKESDPESSTIHKMITLWANFANSGKPIPTVMDILDNVKWESYTVKSKKFMEIGNKLAMQENMNEKRYGEWDKLFPTASISK